MNSRRSFLKSLAVGAVTLALPIKLPKPTPKVVCIPGPAMRDIRQRMLDLAVKQMMQEEDERVFASIYCGIV